MTQEDINTPHGIQPSMVGGETWNSTPDGPLPVENPAVVAPLVRRRKCDIRCRSATRKECVCSCGGATHGTIAKPTSFRASESAIQSTTEQRHWANFYRLLAKWLGGLAR